VSRNEKVVASHQPHFFPWLGYLDKMAKVDAFIINDIVQLETKSPMVRNKIVDSRGKERYINASIDKKGYMDKPNRDIQLSNWNEVRSYIRNVLVDAYRKAGFYYEVWPLVDELLCSDFKMLLDLNMATIEMLRKCFDINTPLILNSSLNWGIGEDKSERLANKVAAVGGTVYLSGNGARKYMDFSPFIEKNISVVYQEFSYPEYAQISTAEFVPNLSAIDMLFNCGIEASRKLFWENVRSTNEVRQGIIFH